MTTTWNTILSGKMPEQIIDFPRNDADGKPIAKIAIRLLRHADNISITKQATFQTDRELKENSATVDRSSDYYKEMFYNVRAKHFVYQCTYDCDPDSENYGKHFFPTPDEVGAIRNEEVAEIMKAYSHLELSAGSVLYSTDPAVWDQWLVEMLANPEEAANFLASIASGARIQFLTHLVSLSSNALKNPSLSGSLVDAGSSDLETPSQPQSIQ